MEKTELKKLLLEGTEKLIAQLGEILDKNSSLYNDLLILTTKYYEGKKEITLGTIKFEDWNILKTQVDKGLLELIDKFDEPSQGDSQNILKKEIAILDAIEWLQNALIHEGYSYKKEDKEVLIESEYIEDVNIEIDGGFSLRKSSDYYSRDSDMTYNSKSIHHTTGKIQDVGSVSVERDDEKDVYYLRCTATNFKKVFRDKISEVVESKYKNEKKEVKSEDKDSYIGWFFIVLTDLGIALRIKNAIDYLAIHFGRKEDAF